MRRISLIGLVCLWQPLTAVAGLYYSGEPMAELPSQWRGFLLDLRSLRMIAVPPQKKGDPINPLRQQYLNRAKELEALKSKRALTATEWADLGAVYLRLGDISRALTTLRLAHKRFPNDFRVTANLGTAWQRQGDLQQAAAVLEQAVRLAPAKWAVPEKYHLKLVRLRLREPKGSNGLDDLFGVRFVNDKGDYEPGKIAAKEKAKLPDNAVAIVQQLCLWLPEDGRLLWLLAELANAFGDVRYAANMMEGCVTQYRIDSRELRRHRLLLRAVVAKMPAPTIGGKAEHQSHIGGVPVRSKRPLLSKIDVASLPPIRSDGVNQLPWQAINATQLGRKFPPRFLDYLKQLDGKKVTLTGFMQPFSEELDLSNFMLIEYPVGCWYCEMPELTGIIYVETPRGRTAAYTRGIVRVTGTLRLNYTDPEEFLYSIRNAVVAEVD